MDMKRLLAMTLLSVLLLGLVGCGEEDHNDGKCDICGKKSSSSYSSSYEEYCKTHGKKAVEWYIKQGLDD